MSESLEVVREQLSSSEINYDVEAALYSGGGNPDGRVIPPSSIHNAPILSPVYNAYSGACAVLNSRPDAELIDEPVAIPAGANWLGRNFLRLLNSSVERSSPAPYRFSGTKKVFAGACLEAEEKFMAALGHQTEGEIVPAGHSQYAYIDENCEPILFTKGRDSSGRGNLTTISFEDIAINGITHPAGTIFYATRSLRQSPQYYKDKSLGICALEEIVNIQALRLSLFAIPQEEITSAFLQEGSSPESIKSDKSQQLLSPPPIRELGRFLTKKIHSHVPIKPGRGAGNAAVDS